MLRESVKYPDHSYYLIFKRISSSILKEEIEFNNTTKKGTMIRNVSCTSFGMFSGSMYSASWSKLQNITYIGYESHSVCKSFLALVQAWNAETTTYLISTPRVDPRFDKVPAPPKNPRTVH